MPRRHSKYLKHKKISEGHFLCRKKSKRISTILSECKDIGRVLKNLYKREYAWRRIGVLTFDGNTKVKQKATYTAIKQHLEQIYKRKIGYGTVVQLYVARTNEEFQQNATKVLHR